MSRMSELHTQQHDEKEPCKHCDTGEKHMNIGEITLEQLSGEDYYVWIKNHPKFGYNVTLECEEVHENSVSGEAIHPDAMESLATLCRTFLRAYEQCQEEL